MQREIDETIRALFPADDGAYHRLQGGNVNHTYDFRCAGREIILRLTPPSGGVDAPALEAVLAIMRSLAAAGLRVPQPLPSASGRLVETLPGEGGAWLVSAVEKAAGVLAERVPFAQWEAVHFEELGRAAGTMHTLLQNYTPPAGLPERPHWQAASNNFNPDGLDEAEAWALERHRALAARVEALPRPPGAFGLIHADLQCANFLIDAAGAITLFDFDDCCHGWRLMDIALPLLDFLVVYPGLERESFAARFLRHFLQGYLPAHPLPAEHVTLLPLFLALLETGLYLQVAPHAAQFAPGTWVGRFMAGRRDSMTAGRPFVALDPDRILQLM